MTSPIKKQKDIPSKGDDISVRMFFSGHLALMLEKWLLLMIKLKEGQRGVWYGMCVLRRLGLSEPEMFGFEGLEMDGINGTIGIGGIGGITTREGGGEERDGMAVPLLEGVGGDDDDLGIPIPLRTRKGKEPVGIVGMKRKR